MVDRDHIIIVKRLDHTDIPLYIVKQLEYHEAPIPAIRGFAMENPMILTDRTALDALLTGATHYVRTGPDAEAAIYYGASDRAHMAAPGGKRLQGVWRLTDYGYHVDWEGGPSAGWQLDVSPGRIAYRDMDGVERGHVSRIVPGDAAGLAG
jgi:hypothetical protein